MSPIGLCALQTGSPIRASGRLTKSSIKKLMAGQFERLNSPHLPDRRFPYLGRIFPAKLADIFQIDYDGKTQSYYWRNGKAIGVKVHFSEHKWAGNNGLLKVKRLLFDKGYMFPSMQ